MNAPKTAENHAELEVLSLREANDRLRLKLKKCWEHSSRAARLSDPLVDFLTDDEGRVVHPGDRFDDGLSTEGLGLDDPDDPEDSDNDDRFGDGLSTEGLGLDDPRRRCHRGETNNTKWPANCKARVIATGRECTVLETWPVDSKPGLGIRASLEIAATNCPEMWQHLSYERSDLNCYVEFTDIDIKTGEDGSLDGVFTFDQLELLGDDKDDKEDSGNDDRFDDGLSTEGLGLDDPRHSHWNRTNNTKWPAYCKARVKTTGRECTVLETWPVDLKPGLGIRASLELAAGLDYDHELSKEELNCYVEFTDPDPRRRHTAFDGVFTFDQLELLGDNQDDPARLDDPRVPSAFETNATKWPAAHPARVIATGRECTVLETWPLDWSNLKERGALNCYVEFVDRTIANESAGRDHHGVFTFDQLEMLGEPAVEPVFGDGLSDKELRLAFRCRNVAVVLDNKCKEVIALEKKVADVVGLFNEQETKAAELMATLKHLDKLAFTEDIHNAVEAAWWRHGAEE